METKKTIFHTRPFQTLFRTADDLLQLALPNYEEIQSNHARYKINKNVEPVSADVWHIEKSLSIGSFMAKYAGIEAFINCIHDDFRTKHPKELPVAYFTGPIQKKRKK
jgi:hypothetical protein